MEYYIIKIMHDPYIDELKNEFADLSGQLKKLKKKFLKTKAIETQAKIIKQIDSIAKKMESNQKRSVKVTKSKLWERKTKSRK